MLSSASDASLDLEAGLRCLGYDRFRSGQQQAVEALLEHRRLLFVAPTGGGKSLVYQLPAVLLGGTTLVVSPLIALMQDQVASLEARGVPATFFASTVDPAEAERRAAGAMRGAYRLIYAAPERLATGAFRRLLGALECPLVAVDEAHCISEWGHDFRPEYLEIGRVLAAMRGARVLACTATATPIVRDEIVSRLGLGADTPQLVHGFARPNLVLRAAEVAGRVEREQQVDALLAEALGEPSTQRGAAIVYAPTRAAAEQEAARLAARGWRAGVYHAGLDGLERERTQNRFMEGALAIVVATNAFGMGIDRADVRAVIHLAPPASVEAYYQEVGRAGRDGARAWGLVLSSGRDLPLRRRLLETGPEGRTVDPAVVEHKWGLFLELMRWIEGGSCRHDAILRYFGAHGEALGGCGQCDVCVALDGSATSEEATEEEVGLVVRKALSGVARVHGAFGLQAAAKLLKGAPDPRLAREGLDRVRTFGALAEHPESWILRLLRRLVTAGWVGFAGGDRPVVVLTSAGHAVMTGRSPARLLLPRRDRGARAAADGDRAGRLHPSRGGAAEAGALDAAALELFETLRRHRLEVARAEGVPPYVVASDRTLRDLALLRPRDRGQLLLAHGVGPSKADRYGAGWLALIAGAS